MLKRIMSLFGLGLLISPSLLYADTITTFALNGFTFQSPAILTGTITIDVTTGITTGINATYTAGSLTDHFTTVQSSSPPGQTGYASMQAAAIQSNDGLEFSFPTSSLVGYIGGVVCTYPTGKNCPFGVFDSMPPMGFVVSEFSTPELEINWIQSGTLDPVSTTIPEPSTFVLLGSGLIGALALNGALASCARWLLFEQGEEEGDDVVGYDFVSCGGGVGVVCLHHAIYAVDAFQEEREEGRIVFF